MKKLYGVVVPIVTPLTQEDAIDVTSLKRLADHCIDSGMQAIYPCGTTGEMMYLSVEERRLAAETVVRHAAGRVPVFVHVGAWNLRDTVELAKHAAEIGADGIAVVTPAFFSVRDHGLVDYFTTVAKSVPQDFPVYLYAIPQCAVNDISPKAAEECSRLCPNIVGIKYSYPDMTRIQQMLRINGGQFSVLVGPDHLFAAVSAMGGDGVVSGNAQIIPAYYKKIWQLLQEKNYEEAAKWQHRTNLLNETLCENNNIAAYKVMLKRDGIIATTKMRRPMENLTPEQEENLIAAMERLRYRGI
ncbi:dihydrodipicolinate synthase family protein [[Clostridium] symbiosum]|uniref:dihydrodipicolinate synthase family protein n=1 Tax=Clostridium symbiosum TaxID=1512 RepID=UPI00210B4A34|nr:dihydrodipicolinate synthase family protein [[Clostridium] symbiosum]MCQ4988766.1 dihydrodipicolinate synthase family protein [[Clostridium] symbiosum]